MWLTQPGPHCWRPCTRASVCASPASTARRRSGPSALATERVAAQRRARRPSCAAARRRPVRDGRPRSPACAAPRRAPLRSSRGAARVQRRARRVLPARREDRRDGAARERRGERLGAHPALVDRHRLERQPARAQQVEQRRVAGVLDGDAVAGRRCASSTRSIASSAPLTTHSDSPAMPSARSCPRAQLGELVQHRRLSVQAHRQLACARARRRGRAAAAGRGCRARGRARPAGTGSARARRCRSAGARRSACRAAARSRPVRGDAARRSQRRPSPGSDPSSSAQPPDRRQPLAGRQAARAATADSTPSTSSAALAAEIRYCVSSVI